MMKSQVSKQLAALVIALLAPSLAFAQRADEAAKSKDRDAIIASVAAYVDAFNAKNADAIAALWSQSGEWVNQDTGERVKGREAIRKQFAANFAESNITRIDVAIDSIRFVTKKVAVEEGVATVVSPDGADETAYTAIHVKEGGGWKLDSVREVATSNAPAAPSHYTQLQQLEWMVGDWVDAGEGSTIETTCRWTKNRNFLTRTFKVAIEGQIELEGTQVIGWDPKRQAIRSWVFDSDGGFGEGAWRRDGDSWRVESRQTLSDGRTASAVYVFSYIDENRFAWQSVSRKVDGEPVPEIPAVVVSRKPSN